MTSRRVLVAYGTRPEAIKLAPVVAALADDDRFDPVVAVTGQHREMLDQVNELFGIVPAHDLNIIRPRQQLHEITSRALAGMTGVIREERPDAVLVQGDTTTTFAAALAAHYEQIPVIHLEAGLRTQDRYNPFPEEMSRRLTSQLSSLHLAPTPASKANLLAEGYDADTIVVTGNTVIDALLEVIARDLPSTSEALARVAGRRMVLVTTHRRESWGEPMARTARALRRLATRFPDVVFLLPAHLNPTVREILLPELSSCPNVVITDPMGYVDFARAMADCEIALTDSGGVQEEAPSLGKPVLVLRDTTERPEAIEAGTARLVGTDEDVVVDWVTRLLTDRAAYDEMAHAVNPYGDGHASARVTAAIAHFFDMGPRAEEFSPD